MFIESLTPEQLVDFARLLMLASFFGGLAGALAWSLVDCVFQLVEIALEKLRGPGDRVRDLDTRRRLHLMAAMAARRELRKLKAA